MHRLTIKKIIKTCAIDLIIALVLTIISAIFLGYFGFLVVGWSSEPEIPIYSVIIDYKHTKFEDLKVGDYITWTNTGTSFTTHQIIAICEDGFFDNSDTAIEAVINGQQTIIDYSQLQGNLDKTKCNIITQQKNGDANANVDFVNYEKNFAGKVVYIMPTLGKIVNYVKNNSMQVLFASAIFICMFIIFDNERPYVRLF